MLRRAVRVNVEAAVARLKHGSAIIGGRIQTDRLMIAGAAYSMETGAVECIDGID
jgi:carbonic anhydrase